jgi:DNA-binding transcriptional LysR family regulator
LLRLGFTGIAFFGVLPEALRRFRTRFPEIVIELTALSSPDIENGLSNETIDLGVLHPPISAPDLCLYPLPNEEMVLALHPLPNEEMVLALPETHPLARNSVIEIAALAGEPLLIAPRSIGPSIHDRIIALCQSCGFAPCIVQEATPMTTLIGLAAVGVGMGFVTQGVAMVARPGVTFRPVRPNTLDLPVASAWRTPEISPVAAKFLDTVDRMVRGV